MVAGITRRAVWLGVFAMSKLSLPDALRKLAEAAKTPADRTQVCFDIMAQLKWQSGCTDRELAALWGVARSTVWGYSTQASRLVKLQLGDPEEIRARVALEIAAVGRAAQERTEETVTVQGDVVELRKPDLRTALSALCEIRNTLAPVPKVHEVTHSYAEKDLDELLAIAARELAERKPIIQVLGTGEHGVQGDPATVTRPT